MGRVVLSSMTLGGMGGICVSCMGCRYVGGNKNLRGVNWSLMRIKYTMMKKFSIYNTRFEIPILEKICAIPELVVCRTVSVAFAMVLIPVITPLVKVSNISSPVLAINPIVLVTALVIPKIIFPPPFSLK